MVVQYELDDVRMKPENFYKFKILSKYLICMANWISAIFENGGVET